MAVHTGSVMDEVLLEQVYLQALLFVGAFAKLRNATISFVMSVCPSAWNNSAPIGRNYMEVYIGIFFENVPKIQILLKSDKDNGYFTRRPIDIFIISRCILLTMRNVSDEICREDKNTHFMFKSVPPPPRNHAV
jgi:hypothetical protein